jgi:hypothetical protein
VAIVRSLPVWPQSRPVIPKTWDEAALAEWATPLAGLNVRPTHITAKEYYSLPIDNLKTYPVYLPSREPPGYWEMLNHIGPRPMIEPETLKTEADWIDAGRMIFEQQIICTCAPWIRRSSTQPEEVNRFSRVRTELQGICVGYRQKTASLFRFQIVRIVISWNCGMEFVFPALRLLPLLGRRPDGRDQR